MRAEFFHVHGNEGDGLRSVEQQRHARPPDRLREQVEVYARAGDIGRNGKGGEIGVRERAVQVLGSYPASRGLHDHERDLAALFQLEEGTQHGIVVERRGHHPHPFPQKSEYAEVERLRAVFREHRGVPAAVRTERREKIFPAIFYLDRRVEGVAVPAPSAVGAVREVVEQGGFHALGLETAGRGVVEVYHTALYARARGCCGRG